MCACSPSLANGGLSVIIFCARWPIGGLALDRSSWSEFAASKIIIDRPFRAEEAASFSGNSRRTREVRASRALSSCGLLVARAIRMVTHAHDPAARINRQAKTQHRLDRANQPRKHDATRLRGESIVSNPLGPQFACSVIWKRERAAVSLDRAMVLLVGASKLASSERARVLATKNWPRQSFQFRASGAPREL